MLNSEEHNWTLKNIIDVPIRTSIMFQLEHHWCYNSVIMSLFALCFPSKLAHCWTFHVFGGRKNKVVKTHSSQLGPVTNLLDPVCVLCDITNWHFFISGKDRLESWLITTHWHTQNLQINKNMSDLICSDHFKDKKRKRSSRRTTPLQPAGGSCVCEGPCRMWKFTPFGKCHHHGCCCWRPSWTLLSVCRFSFCGSAFRKKQFTLRRGSWPSCVLTSTLRPVLLYTFCHTVGDFFFSPRPLHLFFPWLGSQWGQSAAEWIRITVAALCHYGEKCRTTMWGGCLSWVYQVDTFRTPHETDGQAVMGCIFCCQEE